MLQITPQMKILVAVEPADFRRGIDGLARLCQQSLQHDPFVGTVFVFPTISSSRRSTMSGGAYATIVPNSPRFRSSTALPPNRVARTRSKLVGAPPRCR